MSISPVRFLSLSGRPICPPRPTPSPEVLKQQELEQKEIDALKNSTAEVVKRAQLELESVEDYLRKNSIPKFYFSR